MPAGARTSQVSALLELVQRGDQAAHERLVAYAADRLRQLAHAMIHSNRVHRWEQSDDLMQQTLLRLSRSLGNARLDNTAGFLRLAALEMRHALIDMVRRYFGPEGMGTHHHSAHDQPDGHPSQVLACAATVQAAHAERWRHLYDAINELPEEEREVVDFLWIHQFSQVEAATLLGVATKTIARRWARARLRLHEVLADNLPQV
jgi:RNA polymerase sigma-70 factor (ECF subfamily)